MLGVIKAILKYRKNKAATARAIRIRQITELLDKSLESFRRKK